MKAKRLFVRRSASERVVFTIVFLLFTAVGQKSPFVKRRGKMMLLCVKFESF